MTKEEKIQKLSEDDLRKKIIMPLMKAFWCINVRDRCGPSEEGKDILYKTKNVFNEWVDGAIVLKIGDIGKTKWTSSIERELKEATRRDYKDPSCPDNQVKIRDLIFITSGKITLDVLSYINMFSRDSFPNTEIIDGYKLCSLIEIIINDYNEQRSRELNNEYYEFDVGTFADFCEKYRVKIYRGQVEADVESKGTDVTKPPEGGIINT